MSLISAAIGIDPAIAAARKKDWYAFVIEVQKFLGRWSDNKVVANIDEFLLSMLSTGAVKKPLPPAVSGVS